MARLGAVLDAWYVGGPRPGEAGAGFDPETVSPEELEQLRSLGYVQ